MMRKCVSILLSIFSLFTIIIVTQIWLQAFYKSVTGYQSPIPTLTLSDQSPTWPKTARVVVVLISGLGYDISQSLNLLGLEQLARTGASTVIQSIPPTYSQTARMTLVTGAPADINGAPPIDQPPESLSVTPVDTIFARAHQDGLGTALLGKSDWQYLIPGSHLDQTFLIDIPGPEADQAILQAALPILDDKGINLIFIQFTGLEFAAKRPGGLQSNAFQIAVREIDDHLGYISRAIDLNQTILVVLGEHGFTASGGQGGDEIELVRQPLVIAGKSIIPGNYSDIRQIDIAPTISTLLGVAPPTAAQGRILFEMFSLKESDQTAAQLALAQQRIIFAEAYLARIGGEEMALPDSISTDLDRAGIAFSQNNLRGAFQLALLTQEQVDNQISLAKYNRIQFEQRLRLLITAIVILSWLGMMWRRRSKYAGIIVIAALVTIVLYHTLYQLQGYNYSISSLNNFTQLPFDVARRTVVSMLAGGALVLVSLMLANEEHWGVLLGAGYGFSMLVTFAFSLPLFWAFWQNGFTISWHLPSITPIFWQITGSLEVTIAAILGLLIPWPIMLLNVFIQWVRRTLSDTPSQPKSDALPGLRL